MRLAGFPNFIHRAFEYLTPMKPIVVITKAINSVASGELGLGCARFGQAQVIKTQIGRQVGLIMTREARCCSHDIGPFREAAPPPFVVFGNGMKLGKVERDGAHVFCQSVFARAEPADSISWP